MSAKVLEPAFQGVGQKVGIEIWRIENSQVVPLPQSDYGRFYSGDSYIILKTAGKAGAYTYDIHFWLGKDTSQDEAGTAATKTVELDAVLGNRAVHYRELESHESSRLLSYFRPCILPLEGGFLSGIKAPEEENYETRLYTCEGKRVVRLKQVPFTRSTLNHDEIFILDTKDKIYQFNGANTSIQERSKALEVLQLFKDKYHEGKCNVAIVEDGKLESEGQTGEFWAFFGGFAPIGKKVASEDETTPEKIPAKLYCIVANQLQEVAGEFSKSSLRTDKSYLLYCGTDVFIWIGRAMRLEDKKTAMQTAEEFIVKQNMPKSVRVTRFVQSHETNAFKSHFGSWQSTSAPPPFEESRGKVAAMLKQQGGILKGQQTKSVPVEEEVPPLLPENGEIEVWRVDGESKTPLPKEDFGKFYNGDCYICLYSYHSNSKNEHYLCSWIGKDSIEEDRTEASKLAASMFKSLKCKPVQGRIYQGKEPPQFISIFQPMIVLKGGLSSGYKSYIADKGMNDETYSPDTPALIEISGTAIHNVKALQVVVSATSLNSYGCYVLQSGTSVFTWYGNQSTVDQQQLAGKVVEVLKSGVPIKFAKEGKESLAFWLAVGGKQSYNSKKLVQETVREPHLFAISSKGKFEVEEVYNFEQDDLLAEDVMVLDTHAEVIVWVGQTVDPKEKENAIEIGQKYIEMAASADGLSPYVPLYRVPEGSEPCFFTAYFSWDAAKTTVQGNSFKKKAILLFGPGVIQSAQDNNNKPQGSISGATQRASAMAALTSAFKSSNVTKTTVTPRPTRGTQRAAAIAALSTVLIAEKKGPPTKKKPSSEPSSPSTNSRNFDHAPVKSEEVASEEVKSEEVKNEEPAMGQASNEGSEAAAETSEAPTETPDPTVETIEEDHSTKETAEDEKGGEESQSTYSYEQLIAKSTNPVTGIDFKKREAYLSPEDFEEIFKMTKEAFYQMPRWKQDQQKKKVDLF